MSHLMTDRLSPRRLVLGTLACGLTVAALVAIAAILVGSFDATDARFVATSLSFSMFSALGAPGIRAREGLGWLRNVGAITLCAAGASFIFLLIVLWTEPGADVWRAFGGLALLALATSHACLVQTARKETDTPLIGWLTVVSIGAGSFDAFVGILAISGIVHHVDSGFLRLLAVLVVVFVVTSVLPPILRRASRAEG